MGNEKSDATIEPHVKSKTEAAAELGQKRTAGQLEREISQQVQALYKNILGHKVGRVTCQLFDAKVAIVLEASITRPVQLLVKAGQRELVQQICNDVNSAMQPRIKMLLASILDVGIVELLSDTSLTTGRTGLVGILKNPPAVRNPDVIKSAQRRD